MIPALALVLVRFASAMEIDVVRDRDAVTYLHVDGAPMGEVTRKQNSHLSLSDGTHELWFSADPAGKWEVCRGTVSGSTLVTLGALCTGMQAGDGAMARAREAAIALRPNASTLLVSLDGADGVPLPRGGVRITVIRATHSLRITSPDGATLCAGKVDLGRGGVVEVAAGVTGCMGLR